MSDQIITALFLVAIVALVALVFWNRHRAIADQRQRRLSALRATLLRRDTPYSDKQPRNIDPCFSIRLGSDELTMRLLDDEGILSLMVGPQGELRIICPAGWVPYFRALCRDYVENDEVVRIAVIDIDNLESDRSTSEAAPESV